jgi:anti-sigma B factor antagonist
MKINLKHQAKTDIINLDGDFISEPDQIALQNEVRGLVTGGNNNLVIDFSRVKYINSCGLGSLICALTTVRKSGGDIRLVGIGKDVERVMKITRLDSIFHIFPDITSALSQSGIRP